LPVFSSSNAVGSSEYSLGAPYKLIQHGPNLGRKPLNKYQKIDFIFQSMKHTILSIITD
jgi:hypothetical protein